MSPKREKDVDAARSLSAELDDHAARVRSWPNRMLRSWPAALIVAMIVGVLLDKLGVPEPIVVAIVVSPMALFGIALLGAAFRWARLAARTGLDTDKGRSFAASALMVLLVTGATALYVLATTARPPVSTVLQWIFVPFFLGVLVVFILSPPMRMLVRAVLDPQLRREVIGYLTDRDSLWRDAAQERAEQAGLVGRAFPSPSAAEWPAIVQAARSHRDTLRAVLDQMWPEWVYRAATVLAGLFLGPGAIVVGMIGIVYAILGSPGWRGADSPMEIARTIFIGVAMTALAAYVVRRRASHRAALQKTAHAFGGQLLLGRRAGRRLLDWLDEHNWGPAPHLIWLSERGERYAIEGGYRAHPVFVSVASRYGVPRWLDRLWIDSPDDLPAHHLTKVFVAFPSLADRELTLEVAQKCRDAGFSAHLAHDGLRLSRNDSEPAHVAPDALLPLLDFIVGPGGIIERKETN